MLTQINIKRGNCAVTFETVSIDNTDNVFFTNLDADPDPNKSTHWPTISDNQLGPCPSNSSQCTVPDSNGNNPPKENPPYVVTYKCQLHENELGTINVFAVLAPNHITLAAATKDQSITEQQVVQGGKSPYTITGEQFQVMDSNNSVIDSGSGIGPGLQLNAKTDGITVSGTPILSGTYHFTFTVDDDMGGNLQQVQYSMKVV
jgi:Putative Ig domain